MEVNKKSPIPVYYQLKQIILEKIKNGIWLPGDAISSERELCDIFNVSRMTIRQAINELVNEGILYREKGKGTFVSQPRVEQMNIMSFTEAATNKGLEAVTEVKILEIEIPDLYIIEKLGLSDYEDVYYMQRVRKANGQIIGIEEIYLPVRYCRDFEKKDLSSSLYKILRDDYGYAIDHIETSLEAVIPEINELKLFKTEETVPIMKVTGVNVTDKNLRLFYEESIYRSDKYVLNVNIYRK
jgi:Transcriptional regulators